MGLYENIKEIASIRNMSIAQIERETKLSNGSISKWSKNAPSADKLSMVAKYLNVTTDYLLGQVSDPHLTENELESGKLIHALIKGNDQSIEILKKMSKLSDEEYAAIEKFIDLLLKKK